jgi:hypothetical protein
MSRAGGPRNVQASVNPRRGKLSLGALARRAGSNGGVKRVLLVLLGLVALFFGVRAIVHALASDETKIRWLLEDMTDGFNETRMNPILSGLAQEFVDDGSGARKDDVRAALAQLFLQRKDPQTKKFPFRARIEVEAVRVQGTKSAESDFVLDVEESRGELWRAAWKARVHADLVQDSGDWFVQRTRVDTLEGQRLR